MTLPATLRDHPAINVRGASLPVRYEAARSAIAACDRLDECQDWADKAAALASYAKQANDDELVHMATRIQLRAVRRCGELLRAIEPSPGGRPSETRGGDPPSLSRSQAAHDAGLSRDQKRTALRVAAVPEEEFERAVEAERPTVTAMADRGTRKQPEVDLLEGRDPKDFKTATAVRALLIPLAELVATIPVEAVMRGSRPRELPGLARRLSTLQPWLASLAAMIALESPDVKPNGTH